jgi:hypothetical protein
VVKVGHYQAELLEEISRSEPGKGGKGAGKGKGSKGKVDQTSSTLPSAQEGTGRGAKRQRSEDEMPSVNFIGDAPGQELLTAVGSSKDLLRCNGMIWGMQLEFILDSGAALEGVLAQSLVPANIYIDATTAILVKVGDGRLVWSAGSIQAPVTFGDVTLDVNFTVLETTAFSALLGVKFLRRKEVLGMTFHPPQLTLADQVVPLFHLAGESTMIGLPKGGYRLYDPLRAKLLSTLNIDCEVDLFANNLNKTETLHCTPKNSAWGYNWAYLSRRFGHIYGVFHLLRKFMLHWSNLFWNHATWFCWFPILIRLNGGNY